MIPKEISQTVTFLEGGLTRFEPKFWYQHTCYGPEELGQWRLPKEVIDTQSAVGHTKSMLAGWSNLQASLGQSCGVLAFLPHGLMGKEQVYHLPSISNKSRPIGTRGFAQALWSQGVRNFAIYAGRLKTADLTRYSPEDLVRILRESAEWYGRLWPGARQYIDSCGTEDMNVTHELSGHILALGILGPSMMGAEPWIMPKNPLARHRRDMHICALDADYRQGFPGNVRFYDDAPTVKIICTNASTREQRLEWARKPNVQLVLGSW